MLFNSIEFIIFLPIVFILYWFVLNKNLRLQNILLLTGSYVFYGWWDWRFLSLLMLSTGVDFLVGLKIHDANDHVIRKRWLFVSIVFNLGTLGFFKYFNFFVDSWITAFSSIGISLDPVTLRIILPVGISFYTFQTMSYCLDIYKRQLKPTNDFIAFASFVSFFPQLVAGPIERASNLLPQIEKKRDFNFNTALSGVELILWGFFKKVAVADTMALIVNPIYQSPENYSWISLIIATLAFSIQILGDFSGYSDIAIGVSNLFGITLMRNFDFPYLSRNIAEFWKRWHISLSTWFRDYLYVPMGGSKGYIGQTVRNTFITFTVSGLWHGAKWNFIFWGALNALCFLPSIAFKKNKIYKQPLISQTNILPSARALLGISFTFLIVNILWIFFRSDSVWDAISIQQRIFTMQPGATVLINNNQIISLIIIMTFFLGFSLYYFYLHTLKINVNNSVRFFIASLFLILIPLLGQFSETSFIYFQF